MIFKRAVQRYGQTPEPVTPYQNAAQLWDERIGAARVQAKNWRIMAFGCLGLALGLAGGVIWLSAQSRITPYVVEVDKLGEVQAIGPAIRPYKPDDAQIAYFLARSGRRTPELARGLRLCDRSRRRLPQRLRAHQRSFQNGRRADRLGSGHE